MSHLYAKAHEICQRLLARKLRATASFRLKRERINTIEFEYEFQHVSK